MRSIPVGPGATVSSAGISRHLSAPSHSAPSTNHMMDHEIFRSEALSTLRGEHRNSNDGGSHPLLRNRSQPAMEIVTEIAQVMSGLGTLLIGSVTAYKLIARARAKRRPASPGGATPADGANRDETKSG